MAYPGPVPNPHCLIRKNASFGTDLTPCDVLTAMLARPGGMRIGVFDDLRLRKTSTLLVIVPAQGEPVLAETCPACGVELARNS